MTQLPEVEVIRKDLEKELTGKRIKEVTVKMAATVSRHRTRPEFVKALVGRKIETVTRRATWILCGLDEEHTLVVGLGTQGTLTREADADVERHVQVTLTFTTGAALYFADPAKDGEMFVVPNSEIDELPELNPTGIDPLTDTFTWVALSHQLTARNTKLKRLLMDPTFIAGLGPIYSDEILWAAGLSGAKSSADLSSQEVRRLYRSVLEVLFGAVKQGGTYDVDPDAGPLADIPEGAQHLKVYGHKGRPCTRCRQPIRRAKVDRKHDSFFCGQCQT